MYNDNEDEQDQVWQLVRTSMVLSVKQYPTNREIPQLGPFEKFSYSRAASGPDITWYTGAVSKHSCFC